MTTTRHRVVVNGVRRRVSRNDQFLRVANTWADHNNSRASSSAPDTRMQVIDPVYQPAVAAEAVEMAGPRRPPCQRTVARRDAVRGTDRRATQNVSVGSGPSRKQPEAGSVSVMSFMGALPALLAPNQKSRRTWRRGAARAARGPKRNPDGGDRGCSLRSDCKSYTICNQRRLHGGYNNVSGVGGRGAATA